MSEAVDNETKIADGACFKSSSPTRAQVGWIVALLATVVVGLVSVVVITINGSTLAATQRWEYKIISPDDLLFEQEVNKLGMQGWELVSARRATSGSEYSRTASYEMIFKRPISANASLGDK